MERKVKVTSFIQTKRDCEIGSFSLRLTSSF